MVALRGGLGGGGRCRGEMVRSRPGPGGMRRSGGSLLAGCTAGPQETAVYMLFVVNCGPTSEGVTLAGSVEVRSPHGLLPGNALGSIRLYTWPRRAGGCGSQHLQRSGVLAQPQ